MSWEEVEDHLRESASLRLATVKPSARPHITPLGYIYYDQNLYCCTYPDRVKIRNIRSNPFVAALIDRVEEPVKAVLVEGKARILEDSEKIHEVTSAFTSKLGWSTETIIEISPQKVIAWKNLYADGASRFQIGK